MNIAKSDQQASGIARIGSQPIALASGALIVMVIGIAAALLWRTYTGTSPEQERVASARLLQARTTQASEQLVEKTKGLEISQQEAVDQLQVVQDQLQGMQRLLAAQQAETKRLSEQVGGLTGAIDGLRQSFASTQPSEVSAPPSIRKRLTRSRPAKGRTALPHRKRAKSPR